MRVLGEIAILCILSLAALLFAVIAIARTSGTTPITNDIIKAEGSDGTLKIGDYLGLWGTPTGMDVSDGTIDLWWRDIEVDIDAREPGPYSRVQFTNDWDNQTSGTRWRGFTARP